MDYNYSMQVKYVNQAVAEQVANRMPNSNSLESMARVFATFSDATRLTILSAIASSELCVSDIAAVTGMNQTTVSRQLKILKEGRAVKCNRQGIVKFYSIANESVYKMLSDAVDIMD